MTQEEKGGQDHARKVIQFAIEKEQEAVEFYNDLASKVTNEDLANELRKFAQMEKKHKEKLQSIDVNSWVEGSPQKVRDLKIADYFVEKKPTSDMSWQDILTIAMQREMKAAELYSDLASHTPDPGVVNLFRILAAEEKKHKLYFETIYDEVVYREF